MEQKPFLPLWTHDHRTFHHPKLLAVPDCYTDNSLTHLILLYSLWSTLNCMFSFNVSIPGASRQIYLPSSKRGTTRASFGSLRWVIKLPFSSRTIQCLNLKKTTTTTKLIDQPERTRKIMWQSWSKVLGHFALLSTYGLSVHLPLSTTKTVLMSIHPK